MMKDKEQSAQDFSQTFLFDNQQRFSRLGYVAGWEAVEPKWIPVTESVPPVGQLVVMLVGNIMFLGSVNEAGEWVTINLSDSVIGNVSHWLYIPPMPAFPPFIEEPVDPVEPVVPVEEVTQDAEGEANG